MPIELSKIVNVDVTAPKRKTVRCRFKPIDEIPDYYKCCKPKIDVLKSIEGKIKNAYAGTAHPRVGICNFCRCRMPETMVLYSAETAEDMKWVIPIDQVDIDEGGE